MATKRSTRPRPKNSKRARRPSLRRLRLGWLFGFALLLGLLWGGGWVWYRQQDRPTQERAEEVILAMLEFGRESELTPAELRFLLDRIADHIPLNIGRTVRIEDLSGDRTYVIGGSPRGNSSDPVILLNSGYISAYNETTRNPDWVAYRVFTPPKETPAERPDAFLVDNRTRAKVHPDSYINSGYDRGHMAPNLAIALLYGDEAQEATFLMSNIIPQTPELNRRVWRDLEARIIRRYARRFEELWIITGPIYTSNSARRLPGDVKIPDACFKIIVDEHPQGLRAIGFIIPQTVTGDEDPEQFLTSIRTIEQQTGFDFFTELPAEAQETLETWVPNRLW